MKDLSKDMESDRTTAPQNVKMVVEDSKTAPMKALEKGRLMVSKLT